MGYWVDSTGTLREGDEETARRYGLREATEEDLRAHNERLDIEAADTKGPLGLIGEGFERGLAHIQDIGAAGIQPPMAGGDAFGPGGGLPHAFGAPAPAAPAPPPGAESFPEATSEEARLRAKAHPVLTGIGTGLAVAPASAIAGAAAGSLGGPAILGAAAGGIATEALVEAVAQEYDDAWLEQRPFELKRVAAYTAMFGVGDVLLRGGFKVLGSALAPKPTTSIGTRNIVAEAQGRAEQAAGHARPMQSVGAASARDMSEPFDEALATMSDRDATVLARDAEDHYQLIARHAADDLTRIHRGLTESLGSRLKYQDFNIGADAWDDKLLTRQGEWLEDLASEGQAVIDAIQKSPVDYGNAGKQVVADIQRYTDLFMNEADGAQRNYLVDQFKKTLDKRVMQVAGDYRADNVAADSLLEILAPFAGSQEVRGFVRTGLEDAKYWGHNAELQKALNSPWHDMLKHWRQFQQKLYEASGEVKFGERGAGRNIQESTAERMLGVLQKDPRTLHDLGQHVAGVFDGYQRLIEARQSKGIVAQEGLDALSDSVRNLMEDWNLATTIGVAKNRAANALKNPRNWGARALDLAEKLPMGVGSTVNAARNVGRMFGDLHVQKGTPLAEVWDRGLKRYAQHPSLADASINQNYSDWMQEALRARGAPIPERRGSSLAGEVGSKVAGAGLFGLGAAATQQPQQLDENGQPVAQASAGPAGLMGLGLAMLFKGRPRATFWHRAAVHGRALKQARGAVDAVLEQEVDTIQSAARAALELKTTREVAQSLEALNDRIIAQAQRAAPEADPEQLAEYVRSTVDAEFASHAPTPRGALSKDSRVGKLLDASDPASLQSKHPYLEHYDDDGVWQAQNRLDDAASELFEQEGLYDSPRRRAFDDAAAEIVSAQEVSRRIRSNMLKTTELDADETAEQLIDRWSTWVADDADHWLKQELGDDIAPEKLKLTRVDRLYIRARVDQLIANVVDTFREEEIIPDGWRTGLGLKVRRIADDSANIDWPSIREAVKAGDKERAATTLNSQITQRLPKALKAKLAEDVVDAMAAGGDPKDAILAVVHAINQGAESVPMDRETQEFAARLFRDWADKEGSDLLGVNIDKAIRTYAGDLDYRHINAFARGEKDLDPDWRSEELATKLQTALDYAVAEGYTTPGNTWRGVLFTDDELKAVDAAEVLEAHAFMSTSADVEYARRFMTGKQQFKKDRTLNPVLFEVYQRSGVPVNPNEAEVLLRAGTRFRKEPATEGSGARWRLVELETDPKVPRTLNRRSALPWVAGGAFTLGSMTAADKAAAGELPRPPELQEPEDIGPAAPPGVLYREAMRSVATGAPLVTQRAASTALRRRLPKGRDAVRAFVSGRRSLDAAVDQAREAIEALQADPMQLIERMGGSTGDLARTHPSVYMALTEKATQIVGYLAQRVPQRTARTLLYPEGSPPSRDRSIDFVYELVGATMPEQAQADIARLDAPPEEVASFQANWPELWEDLRFEMLGQIQRRYEAGRPVDSERLRRIDGLLGMNGQLDPSGSLEVASHIIAASEAAPAAPASNSPPSQAPSASGRASGRLQTRLAGIETERSVG